MKPLDETQVLKANRKVDAKMVRTFEKLEQDLERVGAATKPAYRLQPPLGGVLQRAVHAAARPYPKHDAAHR